LDTIKRAHNLSFEALFRFDDIART